MIKRAIFLQLMRAPIISGLCKPNMWQRMKRKGFNILQDLRSIRWKFESTVLEENEA